MWGRLGGGYVRWSFGGGWLGGSLTISWRPRLSRWGSRPCWNRGWNSRAPCWTCRCIGRGLLCRSRGAAGGWTFLTGRTGCHLGLWERRLRLWHLGLIGLSVCGGECVGGVFWGCGTSKCVSIVLWCFGGGRICGRICGSFCWIWKLYIKQLYTSTRTSFPFSSHFLLLDPSFLTLDGVNSVLIGLKSRTLDRSRWDDELDLTLDWKNELLIDTDVQTMFTGGRDINEGVCTCLIDMF